MSPNSTKLGQYEAVLEKTEEMNQIVTFQKLDSSGAKFKMKLASSICEKQIKTMK